MKYCRGLLGAGVAVALLVVVAPQVQGELEIDKGQGVHQAHDFNDTFYIQNGLDPTSPDFNTPRNIFRG